MESETGFAKGYTTSINKLKAIILNINGINNKVKSKNTEKKLQ